MNRRTLLDDVTADWNAQRPKAQQGKAAARHVDACDLLALMEVIG